MADATEDDRDRDEVVRDEVETSLHTTKWGLIDHAVFVRMACVFLFCSRIQSVKFAD